jgi:hypothetical protein
MEGKLDMRLTLAIGVILILVAGLVSAQEADVATLQNAASSNPLGLKPAPSPSGLLDLSKATFSHSYSISFFSGGHTSGSLGLLNSSMLYQFSPKLSLTLNLGVLHNTGALWGSGDREATLLPGFHLDYHPSRSFRMSVTYQRYSGYFSPYGSPFYRSLTGRLYPY